MMHTVLFPREPALACESIIAYIDLETNNLDVLSGKIVEIGALVDGSRATFSTVELNLILSNIYQIECD